MQKYSLKLGRSTCWLLTIAVCLATVGSVPSAPNPKSDAGSKAPDKKPKESSPAEVAIAKGSAYLKSAQSANGSWRNCPGTTALALKAIIFNGAPAGSEQTIEKATAYLLANSKFDRVYETALLAMQDLDPAKYRDVIAKCAAFLNAAQLPHGMWTYTKANPDQLQAIQAELANRPAEKPMDKETEKRMKALLGDNSNTQFALLGLRAVRWAGLDVDMDVIRKTQEHFIQTQHADGGWGYKEYGGPATGSMTCAALASLCILDDVFKSGWYFDRRKIRKDNVAKGIQWMRDNFSASANPGGANYCYYMYSMERAGILAKRKQFGEHDWFAEGVAALCAAQQPDGSWTGSKQGRQSIETDTAFVILFLKEGALAHSSPDRIAWVEDQP
jgi:hypothetical protein